MTSTAKSSSGGLPVPVTVPLAPPAASMSPSSSFLPWLDARFHDTLHACKRYLENPTGPPRQPSSEFFDAEDKDEVYKHECVHYGWMSWREIMAEARAFDDATSYKNSLSTLVVNVLAVMFLGLSFPLFIIPSTLKTLISQISSKVPLPWRSVLTLPYRWCRSIALFVVYVPSTIIRGQGGIMAYLLPSQMPTFAHALADAINEGERLLGSRLEARANLERLYHMVKKEELEALRKAAHNPNQPPGTPFHAAAFDQGAFDDFEAKAAASRKVKTYLDDLKAEIEEIREIARTQGCMEKTGYKGIADWAEDAWSAYTNLITAVTAVCALGAGLTYTSIFSASRGDIGLMSWSFSLFIVGLVIATVIQGLLVWCTRLKNYPFSTPVIWEFLLGLFVYGAVGSVVAAVVLLMVSVEILNKEDLGSPDETVTFSGTPEPPAYVAFGTLGVGTLATVVVFLLFMMANGFKVLLWRRSLDRAKAHKKLLRDYHDFSTTVETTPASLA